MPLAVGAACARNPKPRRDSGVISLTRRRGKGTFSCSTLASIAGSMRRRGMTREAIEAALIVENEKRCAPPLDTEEVLQIARSIANHEPAVSGDLLRTLHDAGNAARFARSSVPFSTPRSQGSASRRAIGTTSSGMLSASDSMALSRGACWLDFECRTIWTRASPSVTGAPSL